MTLQVRAHSRLTTPHKSVIPHSGLGRILTNTESVCCTITCARVTAFRPHVMTSLLQPSQTELTFSSKSLNKAFSQHASEHYPSSSIGVYPVENDSAVALLLVANKYSLNNFWYFIHRDTLRPSANTTQVRPVAVPVHRQAIFVFDHGSPQGRRSLLRRR